jgi:hypothetical protein
MPFVATPVDFRMNHGPTCAVDLGFATAQNASNGITFSDGINQVIPPTALCFSAAVALLNQTLLQFQGRDATLILESPLSMAFDHAGNPCHRNVELGRNYRRGARPTTPKGWFYQAGANLTLGSVRFLRSLAIPDNVNVYLIEGFYCSIRPGEEHPPDQVVASILVEHFRSQDRAPLVQPLSETVGGPLQILHGLEDLVPFVPPVLLRPGLVLNPPA